MLKPLLPSLRQGTRYLVFEIKDRKYDGREAGRIISEAYKRLNGERGLADSNLKFLSHEYNNNRGIIAINRKYSDALRAALILAKTPRIISLYTSGLINKAKSKLDKN